MKTSPATCGSARDRREAGRSQSMMAKHLNLWSTSLVQAIFRDRCLGFTRTTLGISGTVPCEGPVCWRKGRICMWEGLVADFNGNHPDQRKDLERISASV